MRHCATTRRGADPAGAAASGPQAHRGRAVLLAGADCCQDAEAARVPGVVHSLLLLRLLARQGRKCRGFLWFFKSC